MQTVSGAPDYPDYVLLKRGPQVLVMEESLNPAMPWLHRTALKSNAPTLSPVPTPNGWVGSEVYAADALAGVPTTGAQLRAADANLIFVPFADAMHYRAWLAAPGRLRLDKPATTAFAEGQISPDLLRPGVAQLEALTDEDPKTYCSCNPTNYGAKAIQAGALGRPGDPVEFSVLAGQPVEARRILFRHGVSTPEGGWFDVRKAPLKVAILLKEPPRHAVTSIYVMEKAEWEEIGVMADYPASIDDSPPALEPGQAFEILLPAAQKLYGIRVRGTPGGTHATCAELNAYG